MMKTPTGKYYDIVKATVEQDSDATWRLVIEYMPYIIKTCTEPETGYVNEDIVSDIVAKLPHRIQNFTIQN